MDDILNFVKSRHDLGSFRSHDLGDLRREEMVIFDIYTFLGAFRIHVGKNLKWNSVWKRIKRAGFELNTAHPKKTSTRRYVCLIPQTGLEEMAQLATEVRNSTIQHVGSKRAIASSELSDAIHQEVRAQVCKRYKQELESNESSESTDAPQYSSKKVRSASIRQSSSSAFVDAHDDPMVVVISC